MTSIRSLVTLLIATRTDPASVNIANFLFAKYKWNQIQNIEEDDCKIYETSSKWGSKLYLWYINQCSLTLNHTNSLFCSQLSKTVPSSSFRPPQDILFLSRHAAASGTLSLTVHPVGIPWLTDNTHVGGIPGKCSPPSFRIASLYRSLLVEAKAKGLTDRFEVTMEATHHGPYVEVPACFVEIGSCEAEWTNSEAGEIWCDVLGQHLGLVPKESETTSTITEGLTSLSVSSGTVSIPESPVSPGGVVVMTIGGGHYVPKMNDMARFGDGLYTGHALTSYSVKPYLDGSVVESPVEGGWRAIVSEALQSTRLALPQAELICLIDKGAFNAEQRGQLTRYLDELGVRHTIKTDEVKKLWKSKCGGGSEAVAEAPAVEK